MKTQEQGGRVENSNEIYPKKIADEMIRIRTESNTIYHLVNEAEYTKLVQEEKEGNEKIYESYRFKDVQEEKDGSITGINYGGERMVIEEATNE